MTTEQRTSPWADDSVVGEFETRVDRASARAGSSAASPHPNWPAADSADAVAGVNVSNAGNCRTQRKCQSAANVMATNSAAVPLKIRVAHMVWLRKRMTSDADAGIMRT